MSDSNQPTATDQPVGDLADFFAEDEADDASMDDDTEQIGQRITGARELLGDSVETLAERLGVTTDTVDAWESGQRPLRANQMARVSGVLGISLSWLIMGRGIEPTAESTDVQSLRSDLAAVRSRLDDVVNELTVLDQRLAELDHD